MMSNHFHLLRRVPEEPNPTAAQLVERMSALCGKKGMLVQLARQTLKEQGRMFVGVEAAEWGASASRCALAGIKRAAGFAGGGSQLTHLQ